VREAMREMKSRPRFARSPSYTVPNPKAGSDVQQVAINVETAHWSSEGIVPSKERPRDASMSCTRSLIGQKGARRQR